MTVSPAERANRAIDIAIQVLNQTTPDGKGAATATVPCANRQTRVLTAEQISHILDHANSMTSDADPAYQAAWTASLFARVLELIQPPASSPSSWDRLCNYCVEKLSVSSDFGARIGASGLRFSAQALSGAARLGSAVMRHPRHVLATGIFLTTLAAASVQSGLYKLPEDIVPQRFGAATDEPSEVIAPTAYGLLDHMMYGTHQAVVRAVGSIDNMCLWATQSVGEHSHLATASLISSLAAVVYLLYVNHKMPEAQPEGPGLRLAAHSMKLGENQE